MRLIDADALKTRVAEETKIAEGLGVEMAALAQTMRDCIYEELENSPTIEAIPVEWLTQRMIRADDESDFEMRECICILADEWQKEQEAQNG